MNTFSSSIAVGLFCCFSANVRILDSSEINSGLIQHAEFVSQISKGATIVLPAGSTVRLNTEVYLPSGVTITTDPKNPATIVRNENSAFGLCVQGASITIENVVLDFAMRGVWKEYSAMIAFKMPGHTRRQPDASIHNVTIRNVTFIDSSPPAERTTKDSWAVNLAHNNSESLKNVRVLHCKQLARRIQLTGNGQGIGGIDGLEISHNFVAHGHANSIAVSSSTPNATFQNVLIAHNELRNCTSIGIFIGADGYKGDHPISLKNVAIVDNLIELDSDSGKYPHCIYIRATSRCDGLTIARNEFNTLAAKGSPRWMTLQGNQATPGTYLQKDNLQFGTGSQVVANMSEIK